MPDLVVRRVWSAFVRYRRLPVGPDSGRVYNVHVRCTSHVRIERLNVAYDMNI